MKEKVIIYGLGEGYNSEKEYYEDEFDVIGVCDREEKAYTNFIPLNLINTYDYDYVIITSNKYKNEIMADLLGAGVSEKRIIFAYQMWWNRKNSDVIRFEYVVEEIKGIQGGLTLLDAGAGERIYKPYCGHLNYISQDFGEYDSAKKEEGFHPESWDSSRCDIISDIVDIPLDDESIDVVLCTEVFEHIKNPELAIKEFARLLKKGGGRLITTAPMYSLTHFAPYHYSTGFNKYWYKEVYSDYGFEILKMLPYGNYFECLIQELLRVKSVKDRYCDSSIAPSNDIRNVKNMVRTLDEYSSHDQGSCEALCFGWLVVARKIN